ncbi:MAG: hypothetical protein PHN31_01285 [Candidatus Gracilibacteria bacterium]|nr:hypothetical protein [Candidatus Gracilibacteria bacterium]
MDLQVNYKLSDDLKTSKEVIERLTSDNISAKLDNYLNKYKKEDSTGEIKVSVEKNKKGLFNGTISASLDGDSYRSEREDFKNLDDLINHLFDHIKEQLSDKK